LSALRELTSLRVVPVGHGDALEVVVADALGRKHLCLECGVRYYDLHRADPVCPKCGAKERQEVGKALNRKPTATRSRSKRSAAPVASSKLGDESRSVGLDDSDGAELLGDGESFGDEPELLEPLEALSSQDDLDDEADDPDMGG
jgi:hypothetical protein